MPRVSSHHAAVQVRVQGRVDAARRAASSAPPSVRPEARSRLARCSATASDAGSVSSSVTPIRKSIDKSARQQGRPAPHSRAPGSLGRSTAPARRAGAPSIGEFLGQALQKSTQQAPKARGKRGGTAVGGGTDVAHPPVPAALSRLRSDESKSTVDSPMSTSSAGPSGQAAPPRPATHLPPASGGADGPAGDSSDEEGAHRPPSPERPPPAPAAPPAPPFAQPTMQLAQGLRPFSAGPLPAADAAPRTTRVSDEDRKELHRARLEAQAAAEKERAETEAHVRGVLVDPDTSIYDILMVEFALQPDIFRTRQAPCAPSISSNSRLRVTSTPCRGRVASPTWPRCEKNMSKMTSRSAATMHDQQNHLIQRTCAREAIGHSPKIVQWETKRKKAWVAAAMVASRERGDGSRLREVSRSKCRDKDSCTPTILSTTLLLFLLDSCHLLLLTTCNARCWVRRLCYPTWRTAARKSRA